MPYHLINPSIGLKQSDPAACRVAGLDRSQTAREMTLFACFQPYSELDNSVTEKNEFDDMIMDCSIHVSNTPTNHSGSSGPDRSRTLKISVVEQTKQLTPFKPTPADSLQTDDELPGRLPVRTAVQANSCARSIRSLRAHADDICN